MKCPNCHKRAISFGQWERFKNKKMFKHVCPHCGQALRTSARTWVVLILMCALVPVLFYTLFAVYHHIDIRDKGVRKLLGVVILLPPLYLICFLEWLTGTYKKS